MQQKRQVLAESQSQTRQRITAIEDELDQIALAKAEEALDYAVSGSCMQ